MVKLPFGIYFFLVLSLSVANDSDCGSEARTGNPS